MIESQTNIPLLTSAFLASLTTGGTTYAFGLYGATLKRSLHLSQSQLDTISSANFTAGLLSWLPGMCVDRFGPKVGLLGGGLLGFVALMSYWTVARQFIVVSHSLIVPVLSILGVLIFLSSALITGSVFKIIVISCGPGTKGSAVGAAKGYVGLGAGAYACLFEAMRRPQQSDLDFLVMAALFNLGIVMLPAYLLVPSKEEFQRKRPDVSTHIHYRALYVGLAVLASLVVFTSLAELYSSSPNHNSKQHADDTDDDDEGSGRHILRAIVILFAWQGPILSFMFWPTATYTSLENVDGEQEDGDDDVNLTASGDHDAEVDSAVEIAEGDARDDKVMESLLSTDKSTKRSNGDASAQEPSVRQTLQPVEPEDRSLYQMLGTLPAWLMAWTCVILVGAGTIMTNNMGQMVESLSFPSLAAPASLALFSVAQAGARVATGAVSEAALTWKTRVCGIPNGVPRPAFLIAASVAGFLSHILLAVTTSEVTFVIGAAFSGAAFGMVWPLMVLIVGEVFGTLHHGANYMFYDGFTSAVGTLLLSNFLASEVYEDHINRNDANSDGLTCYGSACFKISHLIVAGLSLTCVGTSVAMLFTTRHVYARRPARSDDDEVDS